MYYFDPHEIISSLVTPLMDTSKRAREYIVEISLDDAPVRVVRTLSVPSNLYIGHFVYVLVYAMGWDGYHLMELTQGSRSGGRRRRRRWMRSRIWIMRSAIPA